MGIKCKKCKRDLADAKHYFYVESNHQEVNPDSYDTVRAYFCSICAMESILADLFDWHMKGDF